MCAYAFQDIQDIQDIQDCRALRAQYTCAYATRAEQSRDMYINSSSRGVEVGLECSRSTEPSCRPSLFHVKHRTVTWRQERVVGEISPPLTVVVEEIQR